MKDAAPLIEKIVGFLREIGISVQDGVVPLDSFLPGLRVAAGGLVVDRGSLSWPGDLLHEAGHLAVTPELARAALADGLAAQLQAPYGGESEATAWAYAACVKLGLPPEVLFHAGGYRGHSSGLINTFALGVYPGAFGLAQTGMALLGKAAHEQGVAAYPSMLRWLRA